MAESVQCNATSLIIRVVKTTAWLQLLRDDCRVGPDRRRGSAWLIMAILRKAKLASIIIILCTFFIVFFLSLNIDKLSSEINCSDKSSILFIKEVVHDKIINSEIKHVLCCSLVP